MTENTDTKPKLRPAEENIWYVLATVAGEPEGSWDEIEKIRRKNHFYWNGLMDLHLTDKEQKNYKFLFHLSDDDKIVIHNRIDTSSCSHKDKTLAWSWLTESQTLPDELDFSATAFSKAYFGGLRFPRYADFQNSIFNESAYFQNSLFCKVADFENVEFRHDANFHSAAFKDIAHFENTQFNNHADFTDSKFYDRADFRMAEFRTHLHFTDVKLKTSPPFFFGVEKIAEEISWKNISWPLTTKRKAINHINAYERLSLIMSKLGKYHDHHMFYRLEMRARKVAAENPLVKLAYGVYESLCDYGYGFERALFWWAAQMGFMASWIFLCHESSDWPSAVNSLALSIANSHGFLGLHRGPLKDTYALYTDDPGFSAIWAFQSVIGVVLLFFLLLSLRNRFRMK